MNAKLYSKNKGIPNVLPNRIRLSDGTTRTGGQFTEEEIADAGYVYSPYPENQELDHDETIEWNLETGKWELRKLTKEELMERFLKSIERK